MFYCEQFITAFLKLPSCKGIKLLVDTQTEKRFNNNRHILCLPAKPETIRGFDGDVLFDEFALYKDDQRIWEAALPSVTRGYNVVINSTGLGKQNLFYEIYTNEIKYPMFKRYSMTIYQAIEQGLKIDIESIRQNFDEESFRQEYLCQFVDESTTFFPYDLLKQCVEDYDENTLHGKEYMGVDVGRTHDKTCIANICETDKIYLKKLQSLSNIRFDEQKLTIKEAHKLGNVSRLLIDKGGIGYQIAEELEEEIHGAEGVFTNNANFMYDVVTFTKKLMEQGKFKFYDDNNIISAFHKVQKVVNKNNNITFVIPRDASGHGDEAVAIMLALYGLKVPDTEIKMAFITRN